MTVEMVFDLLGVRVDGPRADGESVAIGWRFTDLGEEWTLRLEHGALNSWPALDADVDATLSMARPTLTTMLTDPSSIAGALGDGSLTIDGDAAALARLFGFLEQPAPGFNIIEP
jgi:alkyl sulfatase BDS1-like metallo-beta-lactamase superfamily hydrolase